MYGCTAAINTAIPASAHADPNSTGVVQALINDKLVPAHGNSPSSRPTPDNFVISKGGEFGWPTYYGTRDDPNTPQVTVTCNPTAAPTNEGECPVPNAPITIHIPPGARHSMTPDNQMVVVDETDPANPTEYDLFEVQSDPVAGNAVTVGGMGSEPLLSAEGQRVGSGRATAAGLGSLAGRVRAEEFAAALTAQTTGDTTHAVIPHALSVDVACDNGHVVAPALPKPGTSDASSGSTCNLSTAPDAPPMGGRLQLQLPDNWEETLPYSTFYPWQKVLVRTMATYGMIITDTGADGGFVNFTTDSSLQYTTQNLANPWWASVAAEPCTTNVSAPLSPAGWRGPGTVSQDMRCVGRFDMPNVPVAEWSNLRLLAPTDG